jgi:redox-sensitive bicupin YhaK (pirin superfamily)
MERIATRKAEVGELVIHRALPSRPRRMVGAWCFLDHAGPIVFGPGDGLRVGPHPHIGLQTFTWMIEGEVMHRDSLGSEQVIRPGQVNLMTAGHGISHAEDSVTPQGGSLHAAQLWIALPEAQRHGKPAFRNYPDLPVTTHGGFRVTVLVGTAFGETSPVAVHSPLVGLDLTADSAAQTSLPLDPGFEHAVLVLSGEAQIEGETLEADTLLYLGTGRAQLDVQCSGPARLLVIGGAPFGEDILVWWNFVARNQAEIEVAARDWNSGDQRFGKVTGSPSPQMLAPDLTGVQIRPPGR